MFWDNLTLSWNPHFGWPLTVTLGIIGFCIFAAMVATKSKGQLLRGLALALLVAALANPTLRQENRQAISDIAVIVVDESQSQGIGNRKSQTQTALAELQKRIQSIGNTEIRLVTVRNTADDLGAGTKLFAGLNSALSEIPPERLAGAFFITDGQAHDVPTDLSTVNKSAPLHSLLTGSKSEIDRRVVIDRSTKFGIVGKDQSLTFHIDDQGGDGSPIDVIVKKDGVEIKQLVVTARAITDLPFTVDHAGQNMLEIIVSPLANELTLQNNRAIVTLDGVRDRLRVLLVSGEPHAGERTWRNLLKADAAVDLVHFTILRPPEKQDGTPTKELALIAFPTRELFLEKIDEFDLLIFDRYRRQAILPEIYLANVADYVRRGGAVLISSGPDFAAEDGLYSTPLSDILAAEPTGSVTETPFTPQVTTFGNRHPVTRNLPGSGNGKPTWGRWFRVVDTANALPEETLMAGNDNKPLLVLSHKGEGRVAQMLSDHGWLWARGFEGGGPQTELLRRMAHWLMKEPDLEEEALTAIQTSDTLLIERQTMADNANDVVLTLPSAKKLSIKLSQSEPGIFSARVPTSEIGMHIVEDGAFVAAAAMGAGDAKEAENLKATAALMQPLASVTSGGVAWLEDGMPRISQSANNSSKAGSGWMALRANNQFRVLSLKEVPLFGTLLALASLLLVACAMWFREGR